MRATAILAACLLGAAPAQAARPVLVEMFVSQSCSSCPAADALLIALAAKDKGILPLSLNVTYWNQTGWTDTDSLQAATDRQFWYAKLAGSSDVYTPEAVVDGTRALVGSNQAGLRAAIAAARDAPAGNVAVSISGGAMLTLTVGGGTGGGQAGQTGQTGQIVLFGYDSRHDTHVGSGENAGIMVSEINVVRSITPLGGWLGTQETFTVPHPPGTHVALLLQRKDGAVLGLAAQ